MSRYIKITPWNIRQNKYGIKDGIKYVKAKPVTFNIDSIQEIQEYHSADEKTELKKIVTGRGMFEYYLVEKEEAEKIEAILLKNPENNLIKQIEVLSSTINKLTELLRFRLH